MTFAARPRGILLATLVMITGTSNLAQAGAQRAASAARASSQTVRVVGVVRDEANAIALPGVPVEVVETGDVVYTDVDGRYVLLLAPGSHQVRVTVEGYQPRTINVE